MRKNQENFPRSLARSLGFYTVTVMFIQGAHS